MLRRVMKARVKATGEIVDAVITQRVTHTGEQVYMTNDSRLIEESRLEFDVDNTPNYWTRLEHTYAGMAMQALIVEYRNAQSRHGFSESIIQETCAKECIQFAHALVEKLKEKEERK